MTVSKRTRYEVLRRDENTCRYCHAADQPLTVDHVVPVALGGGDDPSNLVAACKDCNAGKSSSSPDGTLVAQVKEDALRQAKQIEQAYAVLVEHMGKRDEYIDNWADSYTYQPLPDDWRNTIGRWFEMGVPLELVVDAARIACGKVQAFTGSGRFAYMCGIVWNQAHAVREVTSALVALEESVVSEEMLDNERIEAYQTGWQKGQEYGWDAGARRYETRDLYSRAIASVVDKKFFPDHPYFFPGSPNVSEAPADVWAVR